jgi:hypothetical protein
MNRGRTWEWKCDAQDVLESRQQRMGKTDVYDGERRGGVFLVARAALWEVVGDRRDVLYVKDDRP